MNFVLLLSLALVNFALAQKPPPLCENLSRFSCAPGSYDDGTGVIKSGDDLEKETANLREKHKERSQKLALEVWNEPNNGYFKDKAIAAMGLKNSPDCTSEDTTRKNECEKRAIEGLTELLERTSGGALRNQNPLNNRRGNLENQSFLLEDHRFRSAIEKAQKEVSRDVMEPKLESKIKDKIFPQIAAAIVEKLKSLPINDEHKKFMISKVTSIKFDGVDCTNNRYQGVDSLLVSNAVYMAGADIFKFCNGKGLQGNSEFMIAYIIAHELAHSIDPCFITKGPKDTGFHYSANGDEKKSKAEYPIPNIISCLKSPKSIQAKSLIQPPAINNGGPPGPGMGMGMDGPPPQASPNQDEPKETLFCRDQIKEAFSDWMAAEVTPKYIEKNHKLTPEQYQTGYSNIWRSSCSTGNTHTHGRDQIPDTHPGVEDRVDRMILVQPQIREQMKCPPTHSKFIYCDPHQPFAEEAQPGQMDQKGNTVPVPPGKTDQTPKGAK